MADAPRARKLAERIQQIVARMIDTRIKDPRLGFVTVTDVRVTGDLQNATIFYTVLGTEEERTSSAAALASAKGLIRSEVGKQTGLRLTPTIEFILDAVPETAAHLEEALRSAAAHDAEVARLAAQAAYAGESDPYRRPEDDDLDDDVHGDLVDEPATGDLADDEPATGDLADDERADGTSTR
ncbi:30S ribosome-binding factor RbfA [Georgenia muralis]|uniref:Ribosome-binding factor A n=1 Tax=Georgenia muralis TaxID=154117 RepID=A0A3N4Z7L6_9MICO|nr:30S ribosome-binding factor RbfA [Georgenia muralis]RPF27856.1 ribosome-binding factor A [Georgenia muralis]